MHTTIYRWDSLIADKMESMSFPMCFVFRRGIKMRFGRLNQNWMAKYRCKQGLKRIEFVH